MNLIASQRSTGRHLVAALVAMVVLASCGSVENPATLEDLGLAIAADVQQGTSFEVAVPLVTGTSVGVLTAPSGVEATIAIAPDGESMRLSLDVDSGTPAGTYDLGLVVIRDGERQELNWPFDVVAGLPSDSGGVTSGHDSPEAVGDALVAALASGDAELVRSLWPVSSWEGLGARILDEFVPRADAASCEMIGASQAQCFVFAEDVPFALGLTMQQQADGMWVISTVSYDSTN